MAWIFLAESEELPKPWNHGSDRSPIVKKIVTLKPFSCHECGRAILHTLRSGTWWKLCPNTTFLRSISSPEDFHARTLAVQALESAWKEADRGYFSSCSDSLARFDRDSFSWKTSQLSLFGGLTEFSWSSLRWGSIVDGRLYQPKRWEPRISDSDGSYLPTPRASDGEKGGQNQSQHRSPSLAAIAARWPTPTASMVTMSDMEQSRFSGDSGARPPYKDAGGGSLNPTWVEWLMGYPLGWTALEDWATQWFRPKREKRSSA